MATPGAGKTTFALRIAAELLADGTVEAVTVVTPTEHLKTQWAVAAGAVGIQLDPAFRNADVHSSADFHGAVVTYAQVGMAPEVHRRRTMTRRTHNIELVDRDWLEIHPDDAARLWVSDGDKVSVRSRVGQTELFAKVTDRIEPGHVFTSFHFPEARTNLLIGQSADVNTSCPEYKVVAVDVRPMAEQPAFTPALETVS